MRIRAKALCCFDSLLVNGAVPDVEDQLVACFTYLVFDGLPAIKLIGNGRRLLATAPPNIKTLQLLSSSLHIL